MLHLKSRRLRIDPLYLYYLVVTWIPTQVLSSGQYSQGFLGRINIQRLMFVIKFGGNEDPVFSMCHWHTCVSSYHYDCNSCSYCHHWESTAHTKDVMARKPLNLTDSSSQLVEVLNILTHSTYVCLNSIQVYNVRSSSRNLDVLRWWYPKHV